MKKKVKYHHIPPDEWSSSSFLNIIGFRGNESVAALNDATAIVFNMPFVAPCLQNFVNLFGHLAAGIHINSLYYVQIYSAEILECHYHLS